MMRRPFFLLVSFGLMAAVLLSGVSCFGDEKEGELPVYKTGDVWVYETVIDDVDYTITYSVAGTETLNDKDCYVIDMVFNPSLYGMYDTGRAWAAKSDPYFSGVKIEVEGTHKDMPASIVIETSATYPDGSPWPLEVGEEFSLTEVSEITSTISGCTSTETETETTMYKVEGKEDVTVPAGEFSCFVINKYDEAEELMATWWYSDKAKNDVKSLDVIYDETYELISLTPLESDLV